MTTSESSDSGVVKNAILQRSEKSHLINEFFAKRGDNDDIACFEVGKGEKVFIIHDFASHGWGKRREYDNIWLWLKDAIEELVNNKLDDSSKHQKILEKSS